MDEKKIEAVIADARAVFGGAGQAALDAVEYIAAALKVAAGENRNDIAPSAMNNALCDFGDRWIMDGDYLRCRKCHRPHIASKADMDFQHAAGCKFAGGDRRPWRRLVGILTPLGGGDDPLQAGDPLRSAVDSMVGMLEAGEWAEHASTFRAPGDKLAARLEAAITDLINESQGGEQDEAPAEIKSCESCRLATWQRTPTGRIKRKVPGDCSATIPTVNDLVPACVPIQPLYKTRIWPDGGAQCPTWTAIK